MANGTLAASQLEMLSQSGTGITTIVPAATNTDRTLTLPDNTGTVITTASTGVVSQAMLASNVASTGPVFSAIQSVAVTPASNTATKITVNTIIFDTNSNFSTANNRFTPTVAGYYQFNASANMQGSTGTYLADLTIFKNGGVGIQGVLYYNAGALVTTLTQTGSGILYMNGSTDYVELFGRVIGTGTLSLSGAIFNGALVRAA